MDNKPSDKSIKVYQKSDVIFEENSRGDEMYIMRSGKVKLVLGGTRGGAEVGILEQPGEFFGEMALIDESPRSATAIAEEDNTELEVLDRENFLRMIREYPEFALDIMRELSERTRLGNALYTEVIEEAFDGLEPGIHQVVWDGFSSPGLYNVYVKGMGWDVERQIVTYS